MKSRPELDAMLDDLEVRLPGMLAACEKDVVQECFTIEADAINAQSKEETTSSEPSSPEARAVLMS